MNKAIICLGSNQDDSILNIDTAHDCILVSSCVIVRSTPIYSSYSGYQNQILEVESEHDYDSLVHMSKKIEIILGRTPEMKLAGIVPIDIDVVVFNDKIMRPNDYNAQYFIQGYKLLE